MSDVVPQHPGADVMAAFIDGTLPRHEIATVAGHLRDCADCRLIVSETARFAREEEEEAPSRAKPWWLAAAAVLAAVAVTAPVLKWNEQRTSPVERLIAVAPRDHRRLEPRLTGFPWARLQAPSRGDAIPDPGDLKLSGAAGEVLEQTLTRSDADGRRATGIAYLLIGRYDESIAALERAAAVSNEPRAWSDLAAARYAASFNDRPSLLPQALADADRALRLDPRLAEAYFNRALILERMGLRDAARSAWQRYLEIDPGGEWSIEAREHLRRLGSGAAGFEPRMLDTMTPDALATQYPFETRTRAEALLLAEWADVFASSDPERAGTILSRVRLFGEALARANGEVLLRDAVAAIDRANPSTRRVLAMGHREYRDARIALTQRQSSVAEAGFTQAEKSFATGGSPMTQVASYYRAVAVFDQGRVDEANEHLARILGRIDPARHRALAAQVYWQLATCANSAADWGSATRHAEASATLFRALGETANAAFLDSFAAMSLELIGETDAAWQHRLRSFSGLSAQADRVRLSAVLQSAAFSLGSIDKPAAASAILDVVIESGHSEPAQLSFALADRARFASRLGDAERAARSLRDARAAVTRVSNRALRDTIGAQIELAHATLLRDDAPGTAVVALNRTIDTFTKQRTHADLADAYLYRARAFRAAGNAGDALADYATALAEVETQRTTIGDQESRRRFLDTAGRILEDTIDVRLELGDVTGAFETADRARVLLDAAPGQSARGDLTARLAPGVVLVEYAVLPESVVAFCVSGNGIAAVRIRVARSALDAQIASFVQRVRSRAALEEVHAEGAALYRLLIDPLRQHLSGARELVVVPDRQLYALPFAALRNETRKRYLAEELTLRFATSAAAVSTDAAGPLAPALIVADPPTPQWPPLPASTEEASRIAELHRGTLLGGTAATRAAFLAAAPDHALIHFAGHANSDPSASYGALLFAPAASDSGVVGSSDVARLRLARKPLVVLAACGTFRGDAIHVGGMSSLARAFLIAGARGVVGTLWEIDDDVSAPLFLRLHRHLAAGASPSDALRQAQGDLLQSTDPRLAHPATWAPVEYLTI